MPVRTLWSRLLAGAVVALTGLALTVAVRLGPAHAQGEKDKPVKDKQPAKDAPPKDKPDKEPPFKVDTEVLNKPIKREELQRKLAEDASEVTLKQTRLDRVYFAYREEMGNMLLELRFEGVCLAPDFDDATKRDALLREKLGKVFFQVYPDLEKRFEKKPPSVSIGGIKPVKLADQPTRRLQQLVGEQKDLDGTLVSGALYNPDGQLVLEGLLGKEAQKPAVEKLVEKVVSENPTWVRAEAGKPARPWVLNMPAWEPLALLQGTLAAAAGLDPPIRDLCQQTLVRRVYFTYDGDPVTLKCVVEAVCLAPVFNKEKDPALLKDEMTRAAQSTWKQLQGAGKFRFAFDASIPTSKIQPAKSPVFRLQEMANRLPELDGVLIERATFDKNGSLRLQGFINSKDHIKKIEDFLRELEAGNPEWLRVSGAAPGPRWLTEFKVFPESLRPAAFQAALSNGPLLVQRQSRVDRVHFEYDDINLQLRVHGVSLFPDWARDEAQVRDYLARHLTTTWLRDADPKTKPAVNLASIKPIATDPVPRLQESSSLDRNLDGMFFLPAEYRANGDLKFPVLLVKPEHRAVALRFVEGVPADHPCFRPGAMKPWQLDARQGGPLLQPALQQRLANSTGFKEQRQLRLDRVWFTYAGLDIRRPEVRCLGVGLGGVALAPGKPLKPRAEVGEKIADEVAILWGGLKVKANFDDVEMVPHPGPDLQARVARARELDGVRVHREEEARKYEGQFDGTGKLILRGQWRDPKQEKTLRDLMTRYNEVRLPRIDQNGLVLNMDVFRTDQVLLDLKLYAADRLEDALLQRLYFDDKGNVKLQGFIGNEKDAVELQKYLEERLRKQPVSSQGGRGIRVASARILPELHGLLQDVQEKPGLELTPRRGLTAHLRTVLQASNVLKDAPLVERWDGVLLTRGHYDPQGNYVLSGLLGAERQRHQIEVLLQELAAPWREHLPNGFSLEGLRLVAVDPMLARMRVVLPDHPEFDGLTLLRGFHDVQGRLVLRFSQIGPLDRKAEASLKKLLDAHPEWKSRSAGGVRLQVAGAILARSERVLEESLLEASRHLRYDRVEQALAVASTAILHDPEDSTGWYLRALCYLLQNELELADRDLRRTVLLEREGVRHPGPRANLRLERLELLQGKQRQLLNDRREKVLNDVEAGKGPLALSRTP